jgi:hypothetical protein
VVCEIDVVLAHWLREWHIHWHGESSGYRFPAVTKVCRRKGAAALTVFSANTVIVSTRHI